MYLGTKACGCIPHGTSAMVIPLRLFSSSSTGSECASLTDRRPTVRGCPITHLFWLRSHTFTIITMPHMTSSHMLSLRVYRQKKRKQISVSSLLPCLPSSCGLKTALKLHAAYFLGFGSIRGLVRA